jgi:hypothetical protein
LTRQSLGRNTSPTGARVKLNDTPIPSQSQGLPGSGFEYAWPDSRDLAPGTTYYYWHEDLDTNDMLTLHPEPVSVTYVSAPTALTLNSLSEVPTAVPALAAGARGGVGGVVWRRRQR